jgi:hypothetical protein
MTGSLAGALNNCFSGILASGASQSCIKAYAVSQAEFDAGFPIQNNDINVVACKQSGQNCNPSSNRVTSNTVSATPVTISGQSAALSLEVTVSPVVATSLNQQVTYSYRLTNSGNVSLKQPFTVTDATVGAITCTNTADIAPGATRVCTKTYNITQADLDAGAVPTRQATATAMYGTQTVSASAPVPVVTTYQGGRLKLEILANPTTYPAAPASQTVIYTYRLTNTGSVPLSPSPLYLTTSQQSDGRTLTVSCPNTPLADNGDSIDCTATDTLSGAPGTVFINTATARASDGTTTITSNTATVRVSNPLTCSATPVTITASAEADSWVDESSTSATHGPDTSLRVQSRNSSRDSRALVTFTLPSIAPGCVIQSATLRLFASSASSSSRTLQALQVSESWVEATVSWSNQPATGGTTASTASGTGWRQWTVTTIVQSMYSGTLANNGFLIRDSNEGNSSGGHLQQFNSRENSANQPQLVITIVQGP